METVKIFKYFIINEGLLLEYSTLSPYLVYLSTLLSTYCQFSSENFRLKLLVLD